MHCFCSVIVFVVWYIITVVGGGNTNFLSRFLKSETNYKLSFIRLYNLLNLCKHRWYHFCHSLYMSCLSFRLRAWVLSEFSSRLRRFDFCPFSMAALPCCTWRIQTWNELSPWAGLLFILNKVLLPRKIPWIFSLRFCSFLIVYSILNNPL